MGGGAFHTLLRMRMCEFLKRGGPPPFRSSLLLSFRFVGVAAVVTGWWTRLFIGAGKNLGLEIWRIEVGVAVPPSFRGSRS